MGAGGGYANTGNTYNHILGIKYGKSLSIDSGCIHILGAGILAIQQPDVHAGRRRLHGGWLLLVRCIYHRCRAGDIADDMGLFDNMPGVCLYVYIQKIAEGFIKNG